VNSLRLGDRKCDSTQHGTGQGQSGDRGASPSTSTRTTWWPTRWRQRWPVWSNEKAAKHGEVPRFRSMGLATVASR